MTGFNGKKGKEQGNSIWNLEFDARLPLYSVKIDFCARRKIIFTTGLNRVMMYCCGKSFPTNDMKTRSVPL